MYLSRHTVVSNSLQPQVQKPARLLYPWDCWGENIRVGCYFLFQGIFLTQGSTPSFQCLLHWQVLYRWATGEASRHISIGHSQTLFLRTVSPIEYVWWDNEKIFCSSETLSVSIEYIFLKPVCVLILGSFFTIPLFPSLSCVLFHCLPLHLCGVVPQVASRSRLQGRYIKTWYDFILFNFINNSPVYRIMGFPSGSDVKESACSEGRFPWRRKWLPTPVFLPEESHGQRSLVVYSPWGCKEPNTT